MDIQDDFYKIGTEHGILKRLYSRGEFDLFSSKFLRLENIPDVEIGTRQAATKASVGTGQGFQRCNRTTKCESKRYGCRSNQKLCNSKCHGGRCCTNK